MSSSPSVILKSNVCSRDDVTKLLLRSNSTQLSSLAFTEAVCGNFSTFKLSYHADTTVVAGFQLHYPKKESSPI